MENDKIKKQNPLLFFPPFCYDTTVLCSLPIPLSSSSGIAVLGGP